MSEHPDTPGESGRSDDADDVAWYAALTGRLPESATKSAAAEEGKRLRELLRALDHEEAASEKLDADWQRLRFRLRREGLLRPRISRPLAYWAMAASLCLALGVAWLYPRPPAEPPESQVLRGASSTPVVLRVDDPAVAAGQLLEACREAGIAVRRRDAPDGTAMFDLLIPPQPPAALADFFRRQASEVPAPGQVTLIMMAPR